jgi:hypothetical protein
MSDVKVKIWFGQGMSLEADGTPEEAAVLIDGIQNPKSKWLTINGVNKAHSVLVSSIFAIEHPALPR